MFVTSFVSSITPFSGVTVFAYWSGSKFVSQIQFFDRSGEIVSKQKLRHCLATWAQVFVFTVYKTSYEHSLFQRERERERELMWGLIQYGCDICCFLRNALHTKSPLCISLRILRNAFTVLTRIFCICVVKYAVVLTVLNWLWGVEIHSFLETWIFKDRFQISYYYFSYYSPNFC